MSRLALGVGVVFVAAALTQGGADFARARADWSAMGPLPPGSAAPEFAVRTLSGAQFQPQHLEGKVSVLTFWATWCPACRSEIDDLDELDDDYAGREDVQFMAVNAEGVPPREAWRKAAGYAAKEGLGLPIAVDNGAMARKFRVGPIPHTVVLDPSGTVRHVHLGRVSSSTIAEEIEQLLQESR